MQGAFVVSTPKRRAQVPVLGCAKGPRTHMNSQDRKIKQRIARRRQKVTLLIAKQEIVLSGLDEKDFASRKDYVTALAAARHKISRLRRELMVLEAGKLPWF